MSIRYKKPARAPMSVCLFWHEGFRDEAHQLWASYLEDVLLPEYPIKFGNHEKGMK